MMHPCAGIHNAMSELTGNANKTSEQHRELEVSRITRDVKNVLIIHSWSSENFPFPEKAKLMFISMSLTAPQHSDIDCDKANEISTKNYASIINHTHLQKSHEIDVTLARLHSTLKTDNEAVNKNPLILLSQLILLAEREEETKPCFEYELTNYPLSLFQYGMMVNGNKASLCSFLMKVIPKANLPTEIVQVNDGKALIFQIKSLLFTEFSDMYKLYEKHLYSKSG